MTLLCSDDAEFRLFLGDDGRLINPEGLRLRVYNGGVAPALRKVIWRLLLNIFPENLTGQERIDYIKKKSGANIKAYFDFTTAFQK